MVEILSLAPCGIAIVALISEIISVSVDNWVYVYVGSSFIEGKYSGLWKSCTEYLVIPLCDPIKATDELIAVRAMVLSGLVLNIAAAVCGALKLFVMKEQKLLPFAATGLLGAAGLFMMIGFAVFVGTIYPPFVPFGYALNAGFVFCVISWLAAWVAAALFGLMAMREK